MSGETAGTGRKKQTVGKRSKASQEGTGTGEAAGKSATKDAGASKKPATSKKSAASPKPAASKAATATARAKASKEPAKTASKAKKSAANKAPSASRASAARNAPAVKQSASGKKPPSAKKPASGAAGAREIPRPWFDHYPEFVAREIDESAVPDLNPLFDRAVSRYGENIAFESFGVGMRFKELDTHSRAVAAWLGAQGYAKGDRIAVMMPNVMAYPAIMFGILKAGCIVVNVNPLYTPRELTYQIKDSGARALFVLENFAHTVEQSGLANSELAQVVLVAPGDLLGLKGFLVNAVSRHVKRVVPRYRLPGAIRLSAVLSNPGAHAFEPREVGKDDIAFLQYTGGTTGLPKGATLLHRNVASNVAQLEAWIRHEMEAHADKVMITALPLYHVFSLTACLLFFHFGARQVLIANPRDVSRLIDTLKKTPFNCLVLVNTLYNALADHSRVKEVDFSHLYLSIAGGMPTQKAVARKWKELTGTAIIEGYGLSETSPVVTANRLDLDEYSGAIGYPLPSTDITIRDPQGNVLGCETEGELCVRGPQVMAHYWNQPEETRDVMTADGFLRTGDVGVLQEDGLVRIVDRIKDTISVSGFNVYPNEVEGVLGDHPQIAEAAVVGAPDDRSGERVVAYVVPRNDTLTEKEIRDHCRKSLTSYKVPREVVFRDSLPKTSVGKVMRRVLRDSDHHPRGENDAGEPGAGKP